jgi:elongation factor P
MTRLAGGLLAARFFNPLHPLFRGPPPVLPVTQVRKGMAIRHDDAAFVVLTVEHITPGNWRGMVQMKMRNIKTGSATQVRFRAEDRVEPLLMEQHEVEFLYDSASAYVFMNQTSYEQVEVPKEVLPDFLLYVKANTIVNLNYCDGELIGIDLPTTVDLRVKETEPGLKGATVTNVYKPATLETGLVVQVPPFITVGETVRVDTRDGAYVERVKTG